MYRVTEYAKKNPAYIRWKKKDKVQGWIGIGIDDADKNQEAYAYAFSIGLTKWVEKGDKPR